MDTISIPVQAFVLSLLPQSMTRRSGRTSGDASQELQGLANGLAMPSFWTPNEINEAFDGANATWAQASIKWGPVTISQRSLVSPADGDAMWITFINQLRPSRGISAAFVFDLPSDEGGWGGGRLAVVAGAKSIGAIQGYQGRILAHELGHILLGPGHEESLPSNLMFHRRHPRVVSADLLEQRQISQACTRAQTLI